MRKKNLIRVLSLILVLSLAGCGSGSVNDVSSSAESSSVESTNIDSNDVEEEISEDLASVSESKDELQEEAESAETKENAEAKAKAEEEEKRRLEEEQRKAEEERKRAEEEAKQKAEEERIRAEQLNSFSMMYYLAITAEEIRTSKDNRLILDDIYTSLLNDINPGAVDEITQDHLKNLRDIIKSYLSISTKRERLQYIYNQDKAAAIRSAVPNPLAILSMTNSYDWKKLAVSVVYSAVDSYNNYKNASENADKAFLMSGWELDDEEVATVQKNRDRAFDYMVDMVQEYGLDGTLTLNEKAIEKFAEICDIESVPERIRRLVSEEETYKLLGNYWLELADCYFETDKYEKALECVDKYNELSTGIYRQDFNYVKILPKAIVAAQNVFSNEPNQYISRTEAYADAILKNTPKDEDNWSTRYFASQVYLDLYARTDDAQYLKKAYDIAYDNVTILLQGQRDLNTTYLNEVKEVTVEEPDYKYLSEEDQKKKKQEYKDEQKRAKEYNKALKKERKTELPALYEPLVVNCELLFALADEIGISDADKADIEAILKTESNGIFLSKPINDAYSFSGKTNRYSVEMTTDEIIIPANLLTAESTVQVSVTDNNETQPFDDCTVTNVKREESSIDSFKAHITSKTLKKYDWTEDSKVSVEITYHDAYEKSSVYKFSVAEFQDHWYGDKVEFKAE